MLGCSVGVMTEAECLGPCEPGTSVTLDAVIWHEGDSGILVVNVTWKGKRYVGTLLDSTLHEWAPPSFRPGSPSREVEAPVQASPQKRKTRRGGRGSAKKPAPPIVYSIPRTWGADFKPHKASLDPSAESIRPEKRARCDIECPEQKCSKKFRCQNALEYHRIHAHVQNEIAVMTPNKANKANNAKTTRGIQTQTCSEELQTKATTKATTATNTPVNLINGSSQTPALVHKDAKAVALPSSQEGTMTNKAIGDTAKVTQPTNHITSASMIRNNPPNQTPPNAAQNLNENINAYNKGQNGPKTSVVSGTVRPMLSTKNDSTKKVSAPIAVLRPLVPQHVAQKATDKTIASITTPTHTLTISSSQPQYRTVIPPTGTVSSINSPHASATKATTAGGHALKAQLPAHYSAPPRSGSNAHSNTTRTQGDMVSKAKQMSAQPDSQQQRNQRASGVNNRRDSGKSSTHRGSSRSNSMNSPNYSDISDASDGDMDTGPQNDALSPQKPPSAVTERASDSVQSAEERLFCNEELPSPSHTPGVKDGDQHRASPLKAHPGSSVAQSQPQMRNSPGPNKQSSMEQPPRQGVPLHAVPPPQHIMYPYFPFMPASPQMNPGAPGAPVPMSGGAPMYAAPPYFMTYQGLPYMPTPGPGMPPHPVAPAQAFVAVSSSGMTLPHQGSKPSPKLN